MGNELDAIKAVPADAPDSDFAWVSEAGPKGGKDRKLYIGDAHHVELAVQAIAQGLMGNDVKGIPSSDKGKVKAKIRRAISKIDKPRQAYYRKWLDSGKKPSGSPGEAKDSTKANIVSDDGDPFKVGDHVVTHGDPDSASFDNYGGLSIGQIRSMNDPYANVELLNHDMSPSGKIVPRHFLDMSEYCIYPDEDDVDSDEDGGVAVTDNEPLQTPDMLAGKAEDADIDVSAFEPSMAVKAIADDRIEGYLVRFGSKNKRDGTKKPNKDGSYGQYFTRRTEFALDWPLPVRPALYHHGLKGDITAIGSIDKLMPDEFGIKAQAALKTTHPMYSELKGNVDKGKIFWSSGTLLHLMKFADDGEILRWPLVEGSLTYDPVEKDGTNVSHISPERGIKAAYKAFGLPLDVLELGETASVETALKSRTGTQTNGQAPQRIVIRTKSENKKMGETALELTQDQLNGLLSLLPKAPDPLKEAQDRAAAAEKALADEKAKAVAQAQATAEAAQAATKALSNALPVEDPQVARQREMRISVMSGSNRMYQGWNALDMAFYAMLCDGLAKSPWVNPETPLGRIARKVVIERATDTDHKFDREFGVKAFTDVARKRIPEGLIDIFEREVPFKSLEDAWLGKYGSYDAIKSNELSSTGQAGSGTEFVPIVWRQLIWERIRLGNPVAANMQLINMPTNPYYIALEGADPTMYYVPETTDAASLVYNATNTIGLSKPVTAKATLTAKKLAGRLAISMEYGEDSLAFVIPRYHYQLVRAAQNAVDNTLLNGDTVTSATTNINFIDGTPGTAPTIPTYIAFDGMRKFCILTNTAQFIDGAGGAPTLALFRNTRKALGPVYSMDLDNLVWVIDYATYFKCIQLPEFATWISMGAPASNVTGLLPGGSSDLMGQVAVPIGMIDKSPVYVSSELGLSLSTGKKNGTSTTANVFGNAQVFHRTRWYLGVKRDIDFESAVLPLLSDVQIMQVTVRCTEQSFDTTSAALLSDLAV